jgi:hypothetical protein
VAARTWPGRHGETWVGSAGLPRTATSLPVGTRPEPVALRQRARGLPGKFLSQGRLHKGSGGSERSPLATTVGLGLGRRGPRLSPGPHF